MIVRIICKLLQISRILRRVLLRVLLFYEKYDIILTGIFSFVAQNDLSQTGEVCGFGG
jgi:hypothetical protein